MAEPAPTDSATDVINTDGQLFQIYEPLTVLLGPENGDPPTEADSFDGVRCVRVVQSAGGQRLDYCELVYQLEDYLTDRDQPASFTRMVEIRLPDVDATILHRGDYVTETESLNGDGESLTAQSVLRGYHFGTPVRGYLVADPISSTNLTITEPIVFNPAVDERTISNRSNQTRSDGASYLWVHAESCQTSNSQTYHGATPAEWTIASAVKSVCELLNIDETHIDNPTSADYARLANAPELRAVTLPIGTRLPEALDRLLIPFGFNWCVDYIGAGGGHPRIRIFKIGDGPEKELWLQSPGETLDLTASNLNTYEITRQIGDSFNAVRVLGAMEEVELTCPLIPGWPAADDSLLYSDLDKTDPGSSYANRENSWRLWVFNEAGDIDEARAFGSLTCDVPDLSSYFTVYIPHRRNIGEPLSYAGGGSGEQKRPLYVEYSTDAGSTWQQVPEDWSVKLAPDQIGVLFDGNTPPQDLVEAGTSARVRITGTVKGDSRIQGLAERQSAAVNGRDNEIVLDAAEKFMYRSRATTGTYASVIASGTSNDADERDDTDEIQAYAEAIRDQNHHAEVDAEFRLPGWHLAYEIGDLLTRINGREINLDAASATSATHRYPQIVQRIYEMTDDGPSTVLVVDRGTPPISTGSAT